MSELSPLGGSEGYGACDDEAVYLCCTFPEVAFGGRYPLSLPCGSPDFPHDRPFGLAARLSVLLARLFYRNPAGIVNA